MQDNSLIYVYDTATYTVIFGPQITSTTIIPPTKVAITLTTAMDASPNSINHVPRTPTSQAGTIEVRTAARENNTAPAKRRRRCLELQERRVVAEKRRIGVCSSCRAKKITVRFVNIVGTAQGIR